MNAKGLLASAALAILLTTGCAPTLAVRGNILQDYQIADIKVGQDTQSDILRKLGSPTTKAPFDDNTWFYMGQKTEKHGILDAKIDQEKVYQVTFDQQGIVTGIQDVTHKRADIPYSRDSTPTTGNELTVTQQLLGNLGRFNKDENAKKHSSDDNGGAPGR